MIEIWADIEGYDDYKISNLGRVKSLSKMKPIHHHGKVSFWFTKERILTHSPLTGYPSVGLTKSGRPKSQRRFLVHRLIAKAFIPNPENKPDVNHINNIRTDFRIENLEWCTESENTRHAIKMGVGKFYKSKAEIMFIDESGWEVGIFKSMAEAAKLTGISFSTVSRSVRYGRTLGIAKKTLYDGWRFVENYL